MVTVRVAGVLGNRRGTGLAHAIPVRPWIAVIVAVSACAEPAGSPMIDAGFVVDAGAADGGAPMDAGSPGDTRFANRLDDASSFAALGDPTGDGSVKFLLQVDGRTPPAPLDEACYFQSARQFPWHLQFLTSFAELADLTFDAYTSMVLAPATRVWWGGSLRAWPGGTVTFTLYADPNTLTEDDIVAAARILDGCAGFARGLLAFLPGGPDQKQLAHQARSRLDARGVKVAFPEDLARGVAFETYSGGEGFGTLVVVPQGDRLSDYGPRDVVIVESAPADIAVVSALITADLQSLHSHVNLRLSEKGIPNAALPQIYDDRFIASLEGGLVRVLASDDGVRIEPATLADAETFWAARRPSLPPVQADLTVAELRSFDDLSHADAPAFGAKAANLGALHDALPAEHRTEGFGVPLSRYRDYIFENGIDVAVDRLLDDPRHKTDRAFKRASLKVLRRQIRTGTISEVFFATLQPKLQSLGHRRIRFRSSTNVEDLARLSGAGLYDSKSGCLADDLDGDALGPSACLDPAEAAHKRVQLDARRVELRDHPDRLWVDEIIRDLEGDLADEKPVADAVRKVWSSLWTERAFDEREYYGIDHRQVFMGIAVNPSFVLEQANAVAVTNLDPGGRMKVRVVSQPGDASVVAPEDPLQVPELMTFVVHTGTATTVDVVRFATGSPSQHVWPTSELNAMARAITAIHEHFEPNVYPELSPLSLDLEIKHTADGRVVVKQARPFVTR